MKIRLVAMAALLVGAVGFAGNATAFPVTLYDGPGGPGGEFYVDSTGDGTPDFVSFCLELNELVSFNTVYTATINPFREADAGGVAGQEAPRNNDPIDPKTAYLYWSFRNGLLPNYEYDFLAGDENYANGLQEAIWSIENELAASYVLSPEAVAFLGMAAAGVVPWMDQYGWGGVEVLNLTTRAGAKAQDILDIPPTQVPEPGTLLLLGSGLLGLGLMRRRKNTIG